MIKLESSIQVRARIRISRRKEPIFWYNNSITEFDLRISGMVTL